MFMVVGAKYGYTDPTDKLHKTEHYKLIQSLAKEFEEANGSIVCRELLKLSAKKGDANSCGQNGRILQKASMRFAG